MKKNLRKLTFLLLLLQKKKKSIWFMITNLGTLGMNILTGLLYISAQVSTLTTQRQLILFLVGHLYFLAK